MGTIRVTVCAEDPITRAGLVKYVHSGTDIVLSENADEGRTDLVLAAYDNLLPSTVAELRALTAGWAKPVILLSESASASSSLVAVGCQIIALLPRDATTDDRLGNHIRSAVDEFRGTAEDSVDEDPAERLRTQAKRLLREVDEMSDSADNATFSKHEINVLRLASDGLDIDEIARQLNSPAHGIDEAMSGLVDRLQLRNWSHAVAYAIRTGII